MTRFAFLLAVLLFFWWLFVWLVMVAYGVFVPELLPGAVEQGIVLASLSFWQAAKLALLVWLLLGVPVTISAAT